MKVSHLFFNLQKTVFYFIGSFLGVLVMFYITKQGMAFRKPKNLEWN